MKVSGGAESFAAILRVLSGLAFVEVAGVRDILTSQ